MFRKSPTGNPDPIAFMERLSRSSVGDNYTDMDRYRDFRRVFLDNTRGQRVLTQILHMGNVFLPISSPADPYETYYNEGARCLALNILAILNADPSAIPETHQEVEDV